MVKMTLIQGDCLKALSTIPDNLVLITDPPYGINNNLEWLSQIHLRDGKMPNKSDDKIVGDDKQFDISPFLIFKRRLIFGFPYIYDKEATGWIVWDKQPKIAERTIISPVEVASTTLRTGWDIFRCMWGGFMRDLDIVEKRYEHPTQKPLKLMFRLIEKFTKPTDIIFDPFLGSGTTMLASLKNGRSCIGIEIEPKYIDICKKRLNWGSSLSDKIEWEFKDMSQNNQTVGSEEK